MTESESIADTEASSFESEGGEAELTENEATETGTESATDVEESDTAPIVTEETTTADPVVELD